MIVQPRIGILPLYLTLYDEVSPDDRPQRQAFAERVEHKLTDAGLGVEFADISCVRHEIGVAIDDLISRDIHLLATLHLAYSPSLESVDLLAAIDLPLLLLDTTPAPSFDETATMADMSANHGIHGVQDLACMLKRRKRPYSLAVGHIDDPAFIEQVSSAARAAVAANALTSMDVLLFGDQFEGMGDFAVNPEVLETTLGITVRQFPVADIARRMGAITEDQLSSEEHRDRDTFDCSAVSSETLRTTNHVGLAIRAMLHEFDAGAFSFNFESFTRAAGAPTVPFLEASKAMSGHTGYAGERDALTAAFVGALLSAFGDVTFTEMFCPDWAGGALFMSHMGECNVALAEGPVKLVEKEYAFGDVRNPVVPVFRPRSGPATLANIAPGPDDTFSIIAACVRVLDRGPAPGFPDVPHYWICPQDTDLKTFLRTYSEFGGTHHLALILGDRIDSMACMAEFLQLPFRLI